jgi:hypothetical protein
MQGSQLDAKQAARQMKLIASQARISGRQIQFGFFLLGSAQPSCRRPSGLADKGVGNLAAAIANAAAFAGEIVDTLRGGKREAA